MYNLNKEELEDLFIKQSKTCKEIAKYFNLPIITIQRHLRKHNLRKIRKETPSYDEIIQLKQKGKTQTEIAKLYGISKYTISKTVRRKQKFESVHQINNSKVDESNEMFWYLVGLISADGHVCSTNSIDIYQTNSLFLTKLGNFFEHTGKLTSCITKNSTKNKIYRLPLYSIKLKQWFVEKGIENDKRYNCPFLLVPEEFMKYYIRGIFDGDGCLYYSFTSGILISSQIEISSASELMLTGLMKYLNKYKPKRYIVNRNQGICEKIIINTKKEIEDFLKWMYSGKYLDYCLFRKYRSYLMLMEIFKLQESVQNQAIFNIENNKI